MFIVQYQGLILVMQYWKDDTLQQMEVVSNVKLPPSNVSIKATKVSASANQKAEQQYFNQ